MNAIKILLVLFLALTGTAVADTSSGGMELGFQHSNNDFEPVQNTLPFLLSVNALENSSVNVNFSISGLLAHDAGSQVVMNKKYNLSISTDFHGYTLSCGHLSNGESGVHHYTRDNSTVSNEDRLAALNSKNSAGGEYCGVSRKTEGAWLTHEFGAKYFFTEEKIPGKNTYFNDISGLEMTTTYQWGPSVTIKATAFTGITDPGKYVSWSIDTSTTTYPGVDLFARAADGYGSSLSTPGHKQATFTIGVRLY